jgi:hypothetical protein
MTLFDASAETREWHPATSREGCKKILSRLRSMGLAIELVDDQGTGDTILSTACIFDGPDADPRVNRWQSNNETDKEWES